MSNLDKLLDELEPVLNKSLVKLVNKSLELCAKICDSADKSTPPSELAAKIRENKLTNKG